LAIKSGTEFYRESSLEQSHQVIDASVVRVASVKAKGGCDTSVWVEFQPPGSMTKVTYHNPLNLFSQSSPIGFLDHSDPDCANSKWQVGDKLQLAYVPENPRLNRPYWGTLKTGIQTSEWKLSAGTATFFAVLGTLTYWRTRRRMAKA
jgi:hypothetical protein